MFFCLPELEKSYFGSIGFSKRYSTALSSDEKRRVGQKNRL